MKRVGNFGLKKTTLLNGYFFLYITYTAKNEEILKEIRYGTEKIQNIIQKVLKETPANTKRIKALMGMNIHVEKSDADSVSLPLVNEDENDKDCDGMKIKLPLKVSLKMIINNNQIR